MFYPWDMKQDIDVRENFFKNRLLFFGAFLLARCIDIPETLIKAGEDLRPVPNEYFGFVGLNLAIAVTGMITRRHAVHLILPVLWFALIFFYVLMSSLGYIASDGQS